MINAQLDGDELVLDFPRDGRLLGAIRSLPMRRYSRGKWRVAYVRENWEALRMMGVSLKGIKPPKVGAYAISSYGDGQLAVRVPNTTDNLNLCRALPDARRWHHDVRAWICSPSRTNVAYIQEHWPNAEWTDDARKLAGATLEATRGVDVERKTGKLPKIRDYKFSDKPHPDTGEPVKPMEHQVRAFALARDLDAFALFMEQGTGKSRVFIDDATYNYIKGKINGALVIALNSLKYMWEGEIELMTPRGVETRCIIYRAGMSRAERDELTDVLRRPDPDRLTYLVMNVEAFSSDKGRKIAEQFLARYRAIMGVDESTSIKSHSAKRAKAIVKLGKMAVLRRILTGTPVTQGPLDLFMPFRFLDDRILGFSSFYGFKNHFALLGGYQGKQIIEYTNLDELHRLVAPHSFRVTRDECLDLPPKQYQKIIVDLAPEQARIYKDLKEDMITNFAGVDVTTPMVITQLMRLQQVVGGFLPLEHVTEDEESGLVTRRFEPRAIPGDNPKIDALLTFVEEVPNDAKIIVWARFRAEISLIARALRKRHGAASVVEFHGGVNTRDRDRAVKAFQQGGARFFVGQTDTGGRGLTLTAAAYVVYYSNSFSLESRLQSEDRAHRIGQGKTVLYVDLVARKTIDEKLLLKLRSKKEIANIVTGDEWREWI